MNIKNDDISQYIEDIIPEDIYQYSGEIKVGDIIEGKIIEITDEGVYVDIGSKTDGFIPIEEFSRIKDINKFLKPQQIINVYVSKLDYDNVHILSYKRAKETELLSKLKEDFENHKPLDANIISTVDKGYIVDIGGVEAFLPFNEINKEIKHKISLQKDITNADFSFKVIIKNFNFSEDKRLKIIVSNKLYEEKIKQELREKLFSQMKEGDEVIGTVKNITNFGAFVDINGVDALLHISNIAWYKLNHPQEVLNPGDKIRVKILKLDKGQGKIEIGLKQLFPHPWDEVDKKYKSGEVIKCKITNITNFGLFAEIEPGVEGLVHISEVVWGNKNIDLKRMFKLGQEIEAKIMAINKVERKISLSIKKATNNPWEDIKKEFPAGTIHKGKITRILPYGLAVSIKQGFDGIVHISDISWTQKKIDLNKRFKVGDYVEYKILDIIPEQETAVLSVKHLRDNPFDKYKVDTIVKCKVKKILQNFLIVELDKDVEGVIYKKEAVVEEKDLSKELKLIYKIGQELDAVIIDSNENTQKIELSIKKLEKIIQKQLIKKFSEIKTPTLGDILSEKK